MFEWDEQKRTVNLMKHGIDFEGAKLIFDGQTIEMPDTRYDYGEQRIGAYGEVNGVLLFVVYTQRGNTRRLISARKAGTHEQKAYYARIKGSAANE
ncbi:BrnT family toxin [Candidatus Magnetomonas plexicatena]|uniref:BrnT family toxin n=1 Tax=Candidatus Magnetomonas plexicatena TaxID=2552947 RepID=UPI00403303E6